MRSLLDLVTGGETGSWSLTESPGGDATVIDVDSVEGEQAWSQWPADAGPVVVLTRQADFNAPMVLKKPLRSRDFRALLGRLARGETETASAPASPASEPVAAPAMTPERPASIETPGAVSDSDPDSLTLADHLRCGHWAVPFVLRLPDWPEVLIDPCSGTWFFDGEVGDLDPVNFARPFPASAGQALSNSDLVKQSSGLRQRPLSELKWHAGLNQSPGRLHPSLAGEVHFMLTQVPTEAMADEDFHSLARVTLRGPTNLLELLDVSSQPEPRVVAFLNACFCSGKLLVGHAVN